MKTNPTNLEKREKVLVSLNQTSSNFTLKR